MLKEFRNKREGACHYARVCSDMQTTWRAARDAPACGKLHRSAAAAGSRRRSSASRAGRANNGVQSRLWTKRGRVSCEEAIHEKVLILWEGDGAGRKGRRHQQSAPVRQVRGRERPRGRGQQQHEGEEPHGSRGGGGGRGGLCVNTPRRQHATQRHGRLHRLGPRHQGGGQAHGQRAELGAGGDVSVSSQILRSDAVYWSVAPRANAAGLTPPRARAPPVSR